MLGISGCFYFSASNMRIRRFSTVFFEVRLIFYLHNFMVYIFSNCLAQNETIKRTQSVHSTTDSGTNTGHDYLKYSGC